jgi:hypothetical protein
MHSRNYESRLHTQDLFFSNPAFAGTRRGPHHQDSEHALPDKDGVEAFVGEEERVERPLQMVGERTGQCSLSIESVEQLVLH